jgi:hypothetical protein
MTGDNLQEPLQSLLPLLDDLVREPVREHLDCGYEVQPSEALSRPGGRDSPCQVVEESLRVYSRARGCL